MTFNVHNLGRGDNPDPGVYHSKLAFLTDVLRRVDADLVVINEVRQPASFDELADRLGYPHRFLGDAPEQTRHIRAGILTRLAARQFGQWHEFPAAVPGRGGEVVTMRFRRPIPWVRVELAGGEDMFAAAVHLKSRRADVEALLEGETARRRQVLGRALAGAGRLLEAAGLRCLLDEAVAARSACHYAVLGDFNAAAGSTAVSLVMGIDDEEGSLLADSEERRLFPVAARMPAEQAFSYVRRGRRLLIDHILVSQRLSLCLSGAGAESQLLLASTRDTGETGWYPRSDHAPVWASFRLAVTRG